MKSYDITPFEYDPDYDLDVFKVLFLDGTHSVPSWKPLNGWLWVEHCTHALEWACQTLKLPTLKVLSFRLQQGGGYIGIYFHRRDYPGRLANQALIGDQNHHSILRYKPVYSTHGRQGYGW